MGADNSKEENKPKPPEQRRTQHVTVTQQRRQESPVSPQTSTSRYKPPVQSPPERPRAPYSYTTENLQSVIKQNNQTNVLERSRNIYNFNSEELYGNRQTPNLYPNLNVSRGDDSFVYVNDYGQTRSPPQPSAPPASVLNDIPTLPTTLNASKRPSTPQTPQVTSRNSSTPQSTEGAIRSALQEAARHPLSQANVSPPQASQLSQRQPFSQDNVVHKVAVSNASPMVPPRPPPINTSQTRVWTSQSINASPNKNGTLSDDKHNAPRPSESNSSANKKGPKTGARDRDNISCPTCGQRYGLAIFQCGNGHGSCQECRSAVKPCGKCLSPITAMRNIAMEAVIADLITACPNDGCMLRFNFDGMERHFKECPFGEMDCPMGTIFGQCSTRCKVADMAGHFDVRHKEQRIAEIGKEMYLFNICMETQKMYLIKNGPYNFLVHVKADEKERKISMTVQLLGTKISADKWSYEFHVYNKRQPMRKYLFVESCHSIGTPVADIFKESQCATLPLSYAMTFVNESALTYKFYIKKAINQRGRRTGPRNNDYN